jgi:hypothetical protein
MTQTCSSTSRRLRQQRSRELMERLELGALLLRRSANVAWYTNGGDNRVDHASPWESPMSSSPLMGTTYLPTTLKPRGCATPACCTASCSRAVNFGSFHDLLSVLRLVPPLENPCRAPSRPSLSSRSPYLCGSCGLLSPEALITVTFPSSIPG